MAPQSDLDLRSGSSTLRLDSEGAAEGAEGGLWGVSSQRIFLAACILMEHCLSILATFSLHSRSISAILDSQCASTSARASCIFSCHVCSNWSAVVSLVRLIFSSSFVAMTAPSAPFHLSFFRSSAFISLL